MVEDVEKLGGGGLPPTLTDKPTADSAPISPEEPIALDWAPDDPELPFNWPKRRKYGIVASVCFISALVAANATSMSILQTWGPDWFGTTRLMFILGLSLYNFGIAIAQLALAPLSENFGRNEIYQVTSVINALLFIPQALSRNIHGYLAVRWFQGMVASVAVSMVGGTVADLFEAHERGKFMNILSLINIIGQGGGGLVIGWVGEKTGFQWCYGVQGLAAVASIVVNGLLLRETRADKILSRRAEALTKATGIKHTTLAQLTRPHKTIVQQLSVSVGRPMKFLFTEPIVSALSLWIGFAWAVIYLGGTATILVFKEYGFSPGELGSVQACIIIGGVIGFFTNYHQEALFRRAAAKSDTGRAPPEARLYWAANGGLLSPIGMMGFAWTGQPQIHWIVPSIMLVISYWGVYCIYVGVFNYLSDAYETWSSSAQAAQSFARNMCGGIFPLFAYQMYVAMGYPQASTVVAALGFLLAAAPFLLIRFGARLRARSPVTSMLVGNL